MKWKRAATVVALTLSCRHTAPTPAPVAAPFVVIEAARARVVPPRVRARFGVKLRSPTNGIAGSTGGALVLDRPGRGRFDVLTPFGGSALTLASDAGAALVMVARDKTVFRSPDAEAVLREATSGLLGLDDLWALVQGDLPFDGTTPRSVKGLDDGTVRAVLRGGKGASVDVIVDPSRSTVVQVSLRDGDGLDRLVATYDGWTALEDGTLLPDRVTMYVPSADLTIDLKIKAWTVLDAVPEGAFAPDVPSDFVEAPMEDVFLGLAAAVPLEPE